MLKILRRYPKTDPIGIGYLHVGNESSFCWLGFDRNKHTVSRVLYLTHLLKPIYKLMIGKMVCDTVLLLGCIAMLPQLDMVVHLF